MSIPTYIGRFKNLPDLIRGRKSTTNVAEVTPPEPFEHSPGAVEDGPEADLLAIVTFLMGELATRSERSGQVRDLLAGLIGHVVAERGANSAPRCLRLVQEIVATPGNAFAGRLAAIGGGSSSVFVRDVMGRALNASDAELGFVRIEALAAVPSIEAALSLAADYTRIVR
jgi:hypothetical protein